MSDFRPSDRRRGFAPLQPLVWSAHFLVSLGSVLPYIGTSAHIDSLRTEERDGWVRQCIEIEDRR